MLGAVTSVTGLALVLGAALALAGRQLRVEGNPLEERIAELLPNSQCGQCGYPGCGQAAAALAAGEAAPTLCPPGGASLVRDLADLLGVDARGGADEPPMGGEVRTELCIGCTRCFKVCPTDAIIGAPKQLHVVVRQACTGCGACVDICPTEGIYLVTETLTLADWHWPAPGGTRAAAVEN